jgi:hypothetical protein
VFENSLKREISDKIAAISRWNLVFKDVPVETTLTLRNSTDYEIKSFGFQFWGSTKIKRNNPMEHPVEDDTSLKPGEEREFTFNIGTNELPEPWGVNLTVVEAERGRSHGAISFDGVSGYEITFDGFSDDGDLLFLFTAFDDGANGETKE